MASQSKNKFSLAAADLTDALKQQFVAALRKGVADGFETVVHATKQDSSNAAVHWMIGTEEHSRASSRTLGKPTDLRATRKHGPKHPWVGRRGEKRGMTGAGIRIADQVVAREVRLIVDRWLAGHTPDTSIYYYNALMSIDRYAAHAELKEAAQAGIERAIASFEREVREGRTRQRPL